MWHLKYAGLGLTSFIETITDERWFWVVKRLSGNDTGANDSHQVGLYLPRWFFQKVFPSICTTKALNPRESFQSYVVPADILTKKTRAIYYNNKFFPELNRKKKYDEFRITCWGGKQNPLQNHDSTGSIVVVACSQDSDGKKLMLVWICANPEEEAVVESWLGTEVVPPEIYGSDRTEAHVTKTIRSEADKLIVPVWLKRFPTGKEIFQRVVEATPKSEWRGTLDDLLIRRRELEFSIFQIVESAHVLPLITGGFTGVNTFLDLALNVANRRKSRTGKSLELNLADIFEGLVTFEVQKKTEGNKKPDFLFPTKKAYDNTMFPATKLHMLAAKTCCKDRWRQVLSEADRISPKHLFTLQEGVSENQLDEMCSSHISLVVPRKNITSFPKKFRPTLLTLEGFVGFIKEEQRDMSFS